MTKTLPFRIALLAGLRPLANGEYAALLDAELTELRRQLAEAPAAPVHPAQTGEILAADRGCAVGRTAATAARDQGPRAHGARAHRAARAGVGPELGVSAGLAGAKAMRNAAGPSAGCPSAGPLRRVIALVGGPVDSPDLDCSLYGVQSMIRSADVARHLNADPSLVARWVRRGMPLTSLDDAEAWHAAAVKPRRRTDASALTPVPATAPAATESADTTVSSLTKKLLEARLLREESDARTAAIKLLELRGQVMRVEVVKGIFGRLMSDCRARLLGLPSRMAAQLAPEMQPVEVQRLLAREVHEILTDLSQGGKAAGVDGGEHAEV